MDDMEAFEEEEVILRETVAVVGILALNLVISGRLLQQIVAGL